MIEKRLKIYSNGSRYVTGGMESYEPIDVKPVEEYDLEKFNDIEIEEIRKNPFSKKLIKMGKKIK